MIKFKLNMGPFVLYHILLFFSMSLYLANCTDEHDLNFMKTLSTELPKIKGCATGQCAVAYVKRIDDQFKTALPPGSATGNVEIDANKQQGFVVTQGKYPYSHAEDDIVKKLPRIIETIAGGGHQVDVYLFTKQSPCCKPTKTQVGGYPQYFTCDEKSCTSKILSPDLQQAQSKNVRQFYVSWNTPYVSNNPKANPPANSVLYYRNFFFSMRQLASDEHVLLLPVEGHEPQQATAGAAAAAPAGSEWFQKSMWNCFRSKKLFQRNSNLEKPRIYATLINAITAECVVSGRRAEQTGKENSYLDKNCWENVLKKVSGKLLQIQDPMKSHWQHINSCLDSTSSNDRIILGPPLNQLVTATSKEWEYISQDPNDFKLL